MTLTRKTHPRPELDFAKVDLLTLYRRLNAAGETEGWSRALKAGCLEFAAAAREGGAMPNSKQAAEYRKMLRRLIELESTPPPARRGRRSAAATVSAAVRTIPG